MARYTNCTISCSSGLKNLAATSISFLRKVRSELESSFPSSLEVCCDWLHEGLDSSACESLVFPSQRWIRISCKNEVLANLIQSLTNKGVLRIIREEEALFEGTVKNLCTSTVFSVCLADFSDWRSVSVIHCQKGIKDGALMIQRQVLKNCFLLPRDVGHFQVLGSFFYLPMLKTGTLSHM